MSVDAKTQYAELIERFAAGWNAGDTDGIVAAFTDDARFVPGPFDEACVGAQAIRRYWSGLPEEQAEVEFRFGEIFAAGPWFAVEFRCTFRRRRTGERVDVRGSLFCETAHGLISEMRMYWDRRADRVS